MTETTILDESAVSEIAARPARVNTRFEELVILTPAERDALCATVKHLRERLVESERLLDRATQRMMRINVHYRQASGLPPYLQAYCMRSEAAVGIGVLTEQEWQADLARIEAGKPYANEADRLDNLQSQLEQLRGWKESAMTLLAQYDSIAETFGGKLGSSKIDNLERGVEQLRADLVEEKRLRAELKQIAQIGISEVSSLGATLKDNALIDFRARAIQLCKDKAAEWEQQAKNLAIGDEIYSTPANKARAAIELANELEKL